MTFGELPTQMRLQADGQVLSATRVKFVRGVLHAWGQNSIRAFVAALACMALAAPANAQLNGLHIKGVAGLDAGSQAPPGVYWGSIYYNYDTGRINNQFGNNVNPGGSVNVWAAMGLVNVVTQKKFLGANYGFMVLPLAGMSNTLEAPRFGISTGPGFADTLIQPINLGWHTSRADFNAGFNIYMPTGRYKANNPNKDNTGFGMWGYEPTVGTTIHLDKAKLWNVSTIASFEMHSNKRDTNTHVGNLFTLEGGFGRKFLKGAANIGAAYYSQWKVSDDTLGTIPSLLVKGRNSATAVGPELTIPLASKKVLFGFFTVRYLFEVQAKTATQGNALVLTAVFPLKPIKIP